MLFRREFARDELAELVLASSSVGVGGAGRMISIPSASSAKRSAPSFLDTDFARSTVDDGKGNPAGFVGSPPDILASKQSIRFGWGKRKEENKELKFLEAGHSSPIETERIHDTT